MLDKKWREHLYEMDYLKDGIGLRGMGQRDPLVEYQREGYQMFNSMIEAIKEESIQLLFHVDIEQVAADEANDEDMPETDQAVDQAAQAAGVLDENAQADERAVVTSAPSDPDTVDEDADEDEVADADEVIGQDEQDRPAAGIVGPAPLSHAEGKVSSKHPKSEELRTPWSDGRTFPGTGRNAPCPCGSGRKYKMCHGQNEQ